MARGAPHGGGSYKWPDGSVFTGHCEQQRPTQGVLVEANGRQYDVTYASDWSFHEQPVQEVAGLVRDLLPRSGLGTAANPKDKKSYTRAAPKRQPARARSARKAAAAA